MTRATDSFDTPGDPDVGGTEAALKAAAALVSRGRVREAITLLTQTNRHSRHPRLEIALAKLRHSGFDQIVEPMPTVSSPFELASLETVDGVPRVTPDGLDARALEQGLARHGCLFVPGLVPQPWIQRLVAGIDHTFDEFDRWRANPGEERDEEARAWFTPFRPVEPYAGRELGGRIFTRNTGGIWTVESPRMLFEVIEMFEAVGLGELVAGHLGEHPALSAAKCNLRRTPAHIPGEWHQDGSFLGRDIATLDVWIALSPCGRDAAGLDIVPHRFDRLLEAGADTVVISHETVLDTIAHLDTGVVSLEYQPGDTLIFDHMFVHRTAVTPAMTKDRYALETWFFAPSRYPDAQIPLVY